jgi:hypothetical protein
MAWAVQTAEAVCAREIVQLVNVKSGFHFLATKTECNQLKDAEMKKMVKKMEENAPNTWGFLSALLSADPKRTYGRKWLRRKVAATNKSGPVDNGGDVEMRQAADADLENEEDDDNYFDMALDEDEDKPENIEEQLEERSDAILRIVSSLAQHNLKEAALR